MMTPEEEANRLTQRLRIERIHVDAIEEQLGVSRDAAAIYSMLWNIEGALNPTKEDREPWEK